MKVGLISFHSFFQPGGVKRHVLGLHKEFKKRGIQSKIIVPRRSLEEKYGKDIIIMGTSIPIPAAGTQGDFCIYFNPFAINNLLKEEKFDVLHFHNVGFPSTIQVLERSNALNILTFHANLEKSNIIKIFPQIKDFANRIAKWKIDGIIGVNPLNLRFFKNFNGPKKVIPNGIDLEEFNTKKPKIKRFLDGKINILFLGRIEERKGLIYLLKAYKILEKKYSNTELPSTMEVRGKKRMKSSSPLRLIVVGEGPLKEDCRKWVENNKLENVVFKKTIKEKDAPFYYRSCDIFCSPAIYGESFGIVLIEAMASGKPVVAFANTGYKEVLRKGKGKRFLVKPRDYKTLAKKLEILIKNKKLRKEMGEWGIKEAQKYSWPKIVDQVLALDRKSVV